MVDKIIPPGTTYKIEEPEFVGRIPVKTELTVLGADEVKSVKLGWMCSVYSGSEVFLIDENNQPIEIPITNKSDLQPGVKIYVTTLVGNYIMTVQSDKAKLSAISESGNTRALLEFDIDDRHCWTSSAAINMRSVKKLEKKTDI